MASLGVAPPDIEPHATDHIPEMIAMMEKLIEDGHAYAAEGHVLFNVPSYPEYGQLSKRDQEELLAGARRGRPLKKIRRISFVETVDARLARLDSPWGRGRPGWHLECSCMIEKHLGRTIDIHGGGVDLVFRTTKTKSRNRPAPMAATPSCATGCTTASSTSTRKRCRNHRQRPAGPRPAGPGPGEAIRLALLNAHYRQPLDWTDDGLAQAKQARQALPRAGIAGGGRPRPGCRAERRVSGALNDDLNTPALASLFDLARQANTATDDAEKSRIKGELVASAGLMGLLQQDPESWFAGETSGDDGPDAERIERLIEARQNAKAAKDYAEADRIRDELAAANIVLEDGPAGTTWRRA